MPSGLYGLSFNPIRRRMAASAESSIPGFNALVVSVDRVNRKCDLWVQGSNRVYKGVRYSTGLRNPPEYIRIRSAVYVRFPSGSRLAIPEIEGPARAVPTLSAGQDQFPPIGAGPDGVLEGFEVVPWAVPGQGVAVTTGRIQFGGVVKEGLVAVIGDTSLASKASGFTPSLVMGKAAAIGNTYQTVPLTAAPTIVGEYRYDLIEIDSALVVKLVPGTNSTDPQLPTSTTGSVPLAYILRRTNINVIQADDITMSLTVVLGVFIILVSVVTNPVPYSVTYTDVNPTDITVTVKDFNGSPVAGHALVAEITAQNGGTGSLGQPGQVRAQAITNSDGKAVFQYFRTNPNNDATEKPPTILFKSVSAPDVEALLWLGLTGSTGQQL